MQQENKDQQTSKENEVDLGVFYNVVSRTFRKIGHFFAAIFEGLGSFVFNLLILIKKNILWLGIATAAGISLGLYYESNSTPSYFAEMVIKTNFESSRLLYQKIEYFNTLIRQRQYKTLSKVFSLTEAEASQLQSFKINSIEDPLQVSYLYKSIYLGHNPNSLNSDTGWARSMDYKTFTQSVVKYDFPLHSIILYSHDQNVYPRVQKGIVQSMEENVFMIQTRAATLEMLKDEESILIASLRGIDSLRSAYYKKIESSTVNNESNKLVLVGGNTRAPEIELYDKELQLKNELMRVKQSSLDQKDIVQVYADFNDVGQRVTGFVSKLYVKFAWAALLIVFVIIIFIRFYKYLAVLEKSYAANSKKKHIQ